MSNYFKKIKQVIRKKKINKLDILNIDKTKFWIGYKKAQLVIIINQNKLFFIIDLDNLNYITSVKCIGFADEIILFMLLVSKVNILYKWY